MKYMITSKEKPINHPIQAIHTDLESFILYNYDSLNDVNNQLVVVKVVPKVLESFRAVLDKEKEMVTSSE